PARICNGARWLVLERIPREANRRCTATRNNLAIFEISNGHPLSGTAGVVLRRQLVRQKRVILLVLSNQEISHQHSRRSKICRSRLVRIPLARRHRARPNAADFVSARRLPDPTE